MKQNVFREHNEPWYRFAHWPIWLWVFFVLPGHLTQALFTHGPDWRHGWWLGIVAVVAAWRGIVGRLPGVERQPYVTHFGAEQPNVPYRVVCYTAAWIAILVPFWLNGIGLAIASITGGWHIEALWRWLYYPLALLVVMATLADKTPRARRSTADEGAERAWFYVALWTVVPAQVAAWGAWRFGGALGMEALPLARLRLVVFVIVTVTLVWLGVTGRLPRTARYHPERANQSARVLDPAIGSS